MTRDDFEAKNAQEDSKLSTNLMEHLNVDEDVAAVLVRHGYKNMMEIAYADEEELGKIEHFDADLAQKVVSRAMDEILKGEILDVIQAEGNVPDASLLKVEGMDEETASVLAAYGIRTMEDLADCATFDLMEIPNMEEERAKELIMNARAPMFASSSE